jgi:hypothetical protein
LIDPYLWAYRLPIGTEDAGPDTPSRSFPFGATLPNNDEILSIGGYVDCRITGQKAGETINPVFLAQGRPLPVDAPDTNAVQLLNATWNLACPHDYGVAGGVNRHIRTSVDSSLVVIDKERVCREKRSNQQHY